jgi:hypothetical protein
LSSQTFEQKWKFSTYIICLKLSGNLRFWNCRIFFELPGKHFSVILQSANSFEQHGKKIISAHTFCIVRKIR